MTIPAVSSDKKSVAINAIADRCQPDQYDFGLLYCRTSVKSNQWSKSVHDEAVPRRSGPLKAMSEESTEVTCSDNQTAA